VAAPACQLEDSPTRIPAKQAAAGGSFTSCGSIEQPRKARDPAVGVCPLILYSLHSNSGQWFGACHGGSCCSEAHGQSTYDQAPD